MKTRSIVIAALAIAATSAALADAASAPKPAASQPAAREQTLLEGLAAGMREIVRTVTPEISLPALELKLPSVERNEG